MKRPPLQVPIAVRVGSGIRRLMVRVARWTSDSACSPSATRSRTAAASCSGESRCSRGRCGPRAGSACPTRAARSTARAPLTSCASRSRASCEQFAHPEARFDVGCVYVGRQRRAGLRLGRAGVRARPDARRSASCASAASACSTCTIPLDLGRPRAGAAGRAGERGDRARRRTHWARWCVDLRDFGARNRVMADAVHPTAFGQIAIAERALAVLARDGMQVRVHPHTPDRVRDDALAPAARGRDLRVPRGQAGRRGSRLASVVERQRRQSSGTAPTPWRSVERLGMRRERPSGWRAMALHFEPDVQPAARGRCRIAERAHHAVRAMGRRSGRSPLAGPLRQRRTSARVRGSIARDSSRRSRLRRGPRGPAPDPEPSPINAAVDVRPRSRQRRARQLAVDAAPDPERVLVAQLGREHGGGRVLPRDRAQEAADRGHPDRRVRRRRASPGTARRGASRG